MLLVRFAENDGEVRVGVATGGDGRAGGEIHAFAEQRRIADLLTLSAKRLRELVDAAVATTATHQSDDVLVLPPIDGRMELWAAGVTYERSREARVEETTERSVYERVYDAERPELFFKAVPWRVVTDGEPIAIRTDSPLNVPEPELAAVSNAAGEIVGYLAANDVSSRSIEGENPLYLPQAKVYAGSAALSAGILLTDSAGNIAGGNTGENANGNAAGNAAGNVAGTVAGTVVGNVVGKSAEMRIELTIRRGTEVVYAGEVSTAALRRRPAELVDWLYAGQPFPHGAVLCTGTGIVPELDTTLLAGDTVDIRIGLDGNAAEVGRLTNPVVAGPDQLAWLVAAADNPLARREVR